MTYPLAHSFPYIIRNRKELVTINRKRIPIPDDLKEQLTDPNVSKLDRMQLALNAHNDGYANVDLMRAMGMPCTVYYRYMQLLKSGDQVALDLYKSGIVGLIGAINLTKGDMPDIPTEDLDAYDIWNTGAKVLCANKRCCLYQHKGKCFIQINSRGRRRYEVDNADYAINTICDIINSGCGISAKLDVYDKSNNKIGNLKSYLVSAYANIPLDIIKRVWLQDRVDGANDLRISNLRCRALAATIPLLNGDTVVKHRGKDIVILRKSSGVVSYVDYTPEMMRILTEFGALHSRARDKRLSLLLDSKNDNLLHQIRIALDLYGLSKDFSKDDVIAIMERLRSEHISKGMTVDHIDGDCLNNRLTNLILMNKAQNVKKQRLTAALVNLDACLEASKEDEKNNNEQQQVRVVEGDIVHWFCWTERYDRTSICMRAGYCSPLQAPVYLVEGVYSVPEYLNEMKRFIEIAKDHKHTFWLSQQETTDESGNHKRIIADDFTEENTEKIDETEEIEDDEEN